MLQAYVRFPHARHRSVDNPLAPDLWRGITRELADPTWATERGATRSRLLVELVGPNLTSLRNCPESSTGMCPVCRVRPGSGS
jgi:hypothetical protein